MSGDRTGRGSGRETGRGTRRAAPRIRALEPLRTDPLRVRVIVGNDAVATLARTRCEELALAPGLAWSAALAQRVAALAKVDAARDAALRRLGRSALSGQALAAALARAGHEAGAVEQAVAGLRADGWLDDAAFARTRAEALQRRAALAPAALAARLEAEGVAADLAAEAARAAVRAGGPLKDALAREARAARRAGVSARTLAGRLARRGHDEDTVRAALRGAGYAVADE